MSSNVRELPAASQPRACEVQRATSELQVLDGIIEPNPERLCITNRRRNSAHDSGVSSVANNRGFTSQLATEHGLTVTAVGSGSARRISNLSL